MLAFLISAAWLDLLPDYRMALVRWEMLLAGSMTLLSCLCFWGIRVQEVLRGAEPGFQPRVVENFRRAVRVVADNVRYRRYLLGCIVYGFSGLMYVAYIPAFLEKDLGFAYLLCAFLLDAVPSLAAFAMTGFWGRLFDRGSPWAVWAWIRFGWGLDSLILAVTPLVAAVFPLAVLLLPVLARISRGSVQGGSWVLWWQIGVSHFARPGGDTSRYLGILIFVNGLLRIGAPAVGALVLSATGSSKPMLFLLGGLGVILSGIYSLAEARRERGDRRLATIASFEAQFEHASETPPGP